MDYIKRSVVVQKVMETKWESGSDGAAAMEIVAATPAADVAPVVHGRWIPFHSEIAGDMQLPQLRSRYEGAAGTAEGE